MQRFLESEVHRVEQWGRGCAASDALEGHAGARRTRSSARTVRAAARAARAAQRRVDIADVQDA